MHPLIDLATDAPVEHETLSAATFIVHRMTDVTENVADIVTAIAEVMDLDAGTGRRQPYAYHRLAWFRGVMAVVPPITT